MDYAKESLRLHEQWGGKIEVNARVPVSTKDDLSLAYTPGVAQPCLEIRRDPDKSYTLTRRHNLCAVITDGSAVLGLGDIGPEAGMPVMEGKCVLFKAFADVDAFPLCIRTQDVDEFVRTVYLLSGSFGGINLEDIAAPRCFEIERKLKELCDIPVFHDDQHGTAIITLAGLTNALRVVGKRLEDVKIVVSGAGAAAISISKLLLRAGARDVTLCDRKGAIYAGRAENMNWIKTEMAEVTSRSADGRHGAHHAPRCHRLCLRKPHAGDLPRRGQGRGCGRRQHRPQRLSEPDQQRAGFPGHLPRRVRRARIRHQRAHEARRRARARSADHARGAERRLHHSQGI